jgi:MFS family permease
MREGSWRHLLAAGKITRLALICLGIWLNAADSLVTSTIMPSIARDIGGYAYFAWPVAGYALGAILGGAIAGWCAHVYGLRFAQVFAALTYATGCVASALAPSIGVFIAGRLFQGLGAGAIVGTCYFAMNAIFPPELWRRVLASLSGVWGVATILGPLLGGLFAHGHSWRTLFWFFACQSVLFAAAALLLVPGRTTDEGRRGIPVRTLGALVAAIAAILAAGVVPALALAALLAGAGALLLFMAFRVDRLSATRLFPPETTDLRSPSGLGYAAIFSFSVASIGFTVYGAAILQTLYGLSPLEAGYVIAVEALAWTVSALVVSEFAQKWDRVSIRAGSTLIALSIAALVFTMPSGSLTLVLATAWVMGSGFGIAWAYFSRHILSNLPDHERPLGSSAIPMAQLVGAAVGSALSGMAANALGAGSGFDRGDAGSIASWIFIAGVPVAIFGWVCAWRATEARRSASLLASPVDHLV